MSLAKKLQQAAGALADIPNAVDLDGVNDFLSRSSDFTGNTDSKTFTLSLWFYKAESSTGSQYVLYTANGAGQYRFSLLASDSKWELTGTNAAWITQLLVSFQQPTIDDTFFHVLISVDLANPLNRSVYINNEIVSATWSIYSNDVINFAEEQHFIGAYTGSTLRYHGRLQDVYLDYNYRDLSIEANRRLFSEIDPDKGLVPVAALPSGAIFTAFTNPDDLTENLGTGGDLWTVNGTMARSNRGANQFNAVASEIVSGDYIDKNSVDFGADNNLLTFALHVNSIETDPSYWGLQSTYGGTSFPRIRFFGDGSVDYLRLLIEDSSGLNLNLTINNVQEPFFRNLHLSVSVDMSDSSATRVHVNGLPYADFTQTTHSGRSIQWSSLVAAFAGRDFNLTSTEDLIMGELWIDKSYIDLDANNPFYDAETNKPKYRGELGEIPTGSQPLIDCPMSAGNAGQNRGSIGDFIVNSSPFKGARGLSEYWARSANFNSSGDSLHATALTGGTSSKTASCVFAFKRTSTSGFKNVWVQINAPQSQFRGLVGIINARQLEIEGYNAAGTKILDVHVPSVFTAANDWVLVEFYCDLADTGRRGIYVNGSAATPTWNTYTNDNLSFADGDIETWIGFNQGSGVALEGDVGFFYLTTDYIDFSDEANRLLFVDALGYPVPLQQSIDDGLIPEGLIRMSFEDLTDLGLNLGTGGNFTVNGTVTQGADVNV